MEGDDLQNSIEFRLQLDYLLNNSKKIKDLELTELYDSKIQDNLENILLHNNDSHLFLEKELSNKKNFFKNNEKSDIILNSEVDNFPNNFDIESLEQILKTSYPNKKFNLNKSLEENSIQNSLALNQALILLKSYDESKENEDGAVNETYLNEIEKILDGIHSPEKKSPYKKKEQEILIEMNNTEEEEEQKKKDNAVKKYFEEMKKVDEIKTKNCKIF